MFYRLMYRRSCKAYRKNYGTLLCIFSLVLSMFSFTNIYCDSYYHYNDAVMIPLLTEGATCDIRIKNITEEEAKRYRDIPYVEMVYTDGKLDLYLTEDAERAAVTHAIAEIFNELHPYWNASDDPAAPAIRSYPPADELIESDPGARIGITLFQVMLSFSGIAAMVLLYGDYIRQRTDDIRTLSAIGIRDDQLHRLFFGECNLLYLCAAVIGLPLGAGLAWLFFYVCVMTDMQETNAVYPVFDLEIGSILLSVLLGYLAVCITYRIVFANIIRLDASYTCASSAMQFDAERSRTLDMGTDQRFSVFFSAVLKKRMPKPYSYLGALCAFLLAAAVFFLNAASYMIHTSNTYGERDAAAIAAGISNVSLFYMMILYLVFFGAAIITVSTKQLTASAAEAVRILYAVGTVETVVYAGFYRYTVRRMLDTVIWGWILGHGFTVLLFWRFGYPLCDMIGIGWFIGSIALVSVFGFTYLAGIKTYYMKNCRDLTVIQEEREHGIA